MKVWSGSAWVEKPTKVWSGSAWVAKPVKVWSGSAWVTKPAAGGITAPVFRSSFSNTYTSRPAGITLDKPTGTVENDILIAMIVHAKSTPALADIVQPAGFTKIGTSTTVAASGVSAKLETWWKRAGASEGANYFFDVWGASNNQSYLAAYSGCTTSGSPIDVFSQNSASTGSTATATGVTTTQANDKLLYIGHNWDGGGTRTPPTGMTERFDDLLYASDETIAVAGATGNRTQTLASSNPWSVYAVALKGAGAPAAPTTSLVTAYTPGAGRDDFTGEVGVRINIATAVTVSWIGVQYSGGGQTGYKVNLYEWFGDTLERTVTIDLTGKAPGQWGWAPITPITLPGGGSAYYALLLETVLGAGKTWANEGPVTMRSEIGNIYATYRVPASGMSVTSAGYSYVGVDLGW